MLSLLSSLVALVGPWINMVIGWFQAKKAAQAGADTAETAAEAQHLNDGAQSVADRDSADAQNTALDQLAQQIDNPVSAVVVTKGNT
jgi:hypothetical protein